jgi:Subtilase family/PA domain
VQVQSISLRLTHIAHLLSLLERLQRNREPVIVIAACAMQVDIAAPGVKTVSTVPLASTSGSDYYSSAARGLVTTDPPLPGADVSADDTFFSRPVPGRVRGGQPMLVTGLLGDCGLGLSAADCPATVSGGVCLVQRGNGTFCAKAAACAAAGGAGLLLYNAQDRPGCERLSGVDLSGCPPLDGAKENAAPLSLPATLTLSRNQGEALRSAVAAGPLTVTFDARPAPARRDIGLAALSGTSMACPTAAGVAGLVWSAHTECTAAELRAALENSATKPAAAPYVDWTPEYGHGIINALSAHRYLQINPCAAARGASAPYPQSLQFTLRSLPVAASERQNVRPRDGEVPAVRWVQLEVEVREAGTGAPAAGLGVQLTVVPSSTGPEGVMCSETNVSTDADGIARTRCRVNARLLGLATVTARIAAQKAGDPPSISTAHVLAQP